MPDFNSYVDYLQNEGLQRGQARLEAAKALTVEMMQMQKNQSAPSVSGSTPTYTSGGSGGGGGASSGGSYSGAMNFKGLSGGKMLPTGARVSQGWGKSRIKYAAGRHTGIDYGGALNSAIRAAGGGVVVRSGSEGAYGNAIHIRHKDGTTGLYAHLNGINVKPGQRVKAGQTIGRMGHTGRAFGTHLHFEIRKSDRYGGDINPNSWFSSR